MGHDFEHHKAECFDGYIRVASQNAVDVPRDHLQVLALVGLRKSFSLLHSEMNQLFLLFGQEQRLIEPMQILGVEFLEEYLLMYGD